MGTNSAYAQIEANMVKTSQNARLNTGIILASKHLMPLAALSCVGDSRGKKWSLPPLANFRSGGLYWFAQAKSIEQEGRTLWSGDYKVFRSTYKASARFQ